MNPFPALLIFRHPIGNLEVVNLCRITNTILVLFSNRGKGTCRYSMYWLIHHFVDIAKKAVVMPMKANAKAILAYVYNSNHHATGLI